MPPPPSDADLVDSALAGSVGAMDELLDRYWSTARAVAYQRLRRWADAEDAAQEAFVLAFRKLKSLRSPERFGGWLFTIVHRSCVESVRRKARRPQPISEIEAMHDAHDADELGGSTDPELRAEIMDAISDLPERYRPVVLLRYGRGMPVKEIGQVLGVPLVAAGLLCVFAAVYLFLPKGSSDLIPVAYTQEPLALKDLARSSDVLMLGVIETHEGQPRFHLERSVYGAPGSRACALPDGLRAGQRVALFGRFLGEDLIVVAGGERGVIHMDGVQQWEGDAHQPAHVRELLLQSVRLRSSASALADIETFLVSDDSLKGVGEQDGLRFSAPITARYLGRFNPADTRGPLMRLLSNREKHPEARSAGAHALIEADPLKTCRMLLTRMLTYPLERMHGESEDGQVMMHCLDLMRASGGADLASDLRTFVGRALCPSLKRHAEAALRGVEGTGPLDVEVVDHPVARRIEVEGREAIVIPGCQGKRLGLVVIFRGSLAPKMLDAAVNHAVAQGLGVVLLPPDARDVAGYLPALEATELVSVQRLTFLGCADGCEDALEAARAHAPERLLLLGVTTQALRMLRDPSVEVAAEVWMLKGEGAGDHVLASRTLDEALADGKTWDQLLPKD